jgi:hypothetical protein
LCMYKLMTAGQENVGLGLILCDIGFLNVHNVHSVQWCVINQPHLRIKSKILTRP